MMTRKSVYFLWSYDERWRLHAEFLTFEGNASGPGLQEALQNCRSCCTGISDEHGSMDVEGECRFRMDAYTRKAHQ
jgi:hypothetical protein